LQSSHAQSGAVGSGCDRAFATSSRENELKENSILLTNCLFALSILIALVAGHAAAQDRIPNQITGEMHAEVNPSGGFTAVSKPPVALPDAPHAHRVIDKKFVAVMGALGGAETLRFTSRKLVLDNEFAAGAPWVTHVTPNQNLVAEYGALYAAEFIVSYQVKKSHSWLPGDRVIRKFWWAYPAAMTAIHIKNGVGNIRSQGPGGCTSMQCAMQMQMQ
jgi:hypothetical protein